ncbi:hypothetical protein GH714_003237 [Hevea brasiliensis]|uniref:HMA domain-containing protein n=1 Tax=Hevea brasiliensis TaxID=3981 RepID=A0A6A6LB82_HEVBR|nr:hypothetical protein GH714_003237 [Hevea brasiliensis]
MLAASKSIAVEHEPVLAEIHAIKYGMETAIAASFDRLEVESDTLSTLRLCGRRLLQKQNQDNRTEKEDTILETSEVAGWKANSVQDEGNGKSTVVCQICINGEHCTCSSVIEQPLQAVKEVQTSPVALATEESKAIRNFIQFLKDTANREFQVILVSTDEDTSKIELKVDDAITDNSLKAIKNSLQAVPGVQSICVDPELNRISVSCEPDSPAPRSFIIVTESTEAGNFKAMIFAEGRRGRESRRQEETDHLQYFLLLWFLVLAFILFLASMLSINVPAIKHYLDIKVVNMLTVGAIISLFSFEDCFSSDVQGVDFFGTSLMFMAFNLLGTYLDAFVRRKRSQVITKHKGLVKETMTLLTLVHKENLTVKEEIDSRLGLTDVIRLIPGAKVKWEKSHANENGVVYFKGRSFGSDSVLSQIAHLVQSDQKAEGPVKEFAKTISKFFLILGIIVSFLFWLAWFLAGKFHAYPKSWLPHSMDWSHLAALVWISVMAIASPCSLPLATEIAAMVAAQVDCIVFNKRTLTIGKPVVVDITLLKNMKPKEFFLLVAAVEANSRHPLAKAIIEHAKECGEDKDNFLLPEAHDFDLIAGRGLKAIVQSKQILVGNKSLMIVHNISIMDDAKKKLAEIERKGQTGVLVSIDSELTGIVAISDPLKPGAREVISILKSMKVRTIMATGDNWGTANSICRQVGIETVIAEAKHQQKVKEVEKLQDQGHAVAMVDGSRSNSLALAAADVGIAVGARTGIAMEGY